MFEILKTVFLIFAASAFLIGIIGITYVVLVKDFKNEKVPPMVGKFLIGGILVSFLLLLATYGCMIVYDRAYTKGYYDAVQDSKLEQKQEKEDQNSKSDENENDNDSVGMSNEYLEQYSNFSKLELLDEYYKERPYQTYPYGSCSEKGSASNPPTPRATDLCLAVIDILRTKYNVSLKDLETSSGVQDFTK